MSNKFKDIMLRAFYLNDDNLLIKSSKYELHTKLNNRLNALERVNDRFKSVNEKNDDFISYYKFEEKFKSIFFIMMRVNNGEDERLIPKELLTHKMIKISELKNELVKYDKNQKNYNYIKHYYCLIKENVLVTTLPINITGTDLQNYLNFLLDDDFFELIPVIDNGDIRLDQIKSICFCDPNFQKYLLDKKSYNSKKNNILTPNIIENFMKWVLKDEENLPEIVRSEIISAKLIIEFKKPSNKYKKEKLRELGALLKPIADLSNITFVNNNNETIISGKDIIKRKKINVELTEKSSLSESCLEKEMLIFIDEILQS